MYHVTLPSNRYMRSGEAEVNMLYNQWFDRNRKSTYKDVMHTSKSILFPHLWPTVVIMTRGTRRVSLAEQELLTIREQLSYPEVCGFVLFNLSCAMICGLLFVLLSSFVGYCIAYSSFMYCFRRSVRYLHVFRMQSLVYSEQERTPEGSL